MIKKIKIFGILLSTNTLLSFNVLTSCNKQQNDSSVDSTYSENSNNDSNFTINEEIKNFIKTNVSPKNKKNDKDGENDRDDKDESIVVIKDLVNSTDSRTKRLESEKIESSLDKLASKLSKTNDEDKVELKDNKIVEDKLKQIIYENCKSTSLLLKTQFSSDFGEVATEKILEVEENGLFFNLKTFDIDKILRGIGYDNDAEAKVKIANSESLKIYRFSTDLKVIVSTNGGKKAQLTINDLNLFVVSDNEQVGMLKKGISDYLQEKFKNNPITVYLEGNEAIKKSDWELNAYFKEILENKSYNLADNEEIKKQTTFYLSNKYLPQLIYKNSTQNIKSREEETPIKIDSQNLIFYSEKDNFLKEGVEIDGAEFERKINFLNFFGNQSQTRQISVDDIAKIKPEHFLKDKNIHNEKYYSLGAGILNVNQWNISGFQLRPIDVKFEIFINCEILGKEIRNLHTCLNNVLDIMKKSIAYAEKENGPSKTAVANRNYVFRIMPQLESERRIVSNMVNEKNTLNFDEILNSLYVEPARKASSGRNFSTKISNKISFEFLVKFSNYEYRLSADKRVLRGGKHALTLDELRSAGINVANEMKGPIEIFFIFNSFKIKVTDNLLVSKLNDDEVNRMD